MLSCRACFLVVCALSAISAPALAQQKPTAKRQLQYATQGNAHANHVFSGTRPPPNAVPANSVRKPSPVGLPVYSSRGKPGFKPAKPSLHINPVPLPASIVHSPPRTVVRSTTTAKKP